MDLDTILQVMADQLGHAGGDDRERALTPELIQRIPGKTARMYQCLPVASDGTLQMALADPLNPRAQMKWGSSSKRRSKWWWRTRPPSKKPSRSSTPKAAAGRGDESFSELLKELGADKEIAEEVRTVASTDNVDMMAGLAKRRPSSAS